MYALPNPRLLKLEADSEYGHVSLSYFRIALCPFDLSYSWEFGKHSLNFKLACAESHTIFYQSYQQLELLGSNISALWGEETFKLFDLGNTRSIAMGPKCVNVKRVL